MHKYFTHAPNQHIYELPGFAIVNMCGLWSQYEKDLKADSTTYKW